MSPTTAWYCRLAGSRQPVQEEFRSSGGSRAVLTSCALVHMHHHPAASTTQTPAPHSRPATQTPRRRRRPCRWPGAAAAWQTGAPCPPRCAPRRPPAGWCGNACVWVGVGCTAARGSSRSSGVQASCRHLPPAPAPCAALPAPPTAPHPTPPALRCSWPHLRGLHLQRQRPVVVLHRALGQVLQGPGWRGGAAGAGQGSRVRRRAAPSRAAAARPVSLPRLPAAAPRRAPTHVLHPRVLEYLRDAQALRGVGHQDALQQVAQLGADGGAFGEHIVHLRRG